MGAFYLSSRLRTHLALNGGPSLILREQYQRWVNITLTLHDDGEFTVCNNESCRNPGGRQPTT